MKRLLLATLLLLAVEATATPLPYREAGLNDRQAAQFLLQRLTYGPLPGQADQMLAQGLSAWVEEQLQGRLEESELQSRLGAIPSYGWHGRELRENHVSRAQLVEKASRDGLTPFTQGTEEERQIYEARLREFRERNEIRTNDDLFDDLRYQKLIRARYARNQLREVLTDFWFNHFNVAALNDAVRVNTPDYEELVLRPQALGHFRDLLQGTAHHPAMLYYLNNAQSSAPAGVRTRLNACYDQAPPQEQPGLREGQPLTRKNGGLNENFAREVMELHTLGVKGGYSQKDVTEVARALSGWTVFYEEADNPNLSRLIEPGAILGYIRRGDFLFRADWHDAEAKTILGQTFPAGGGLEEGEAVLSMLARHPSTARFVCRKLAQRFVSDEPDPQLVDRLAARFQSSDGDIPEVMRELLASPQFWQEATHPGKVKSPLEYFLSSVRACNGELRRDRAQFYWLQRMGQPLYACMPPTGYSEDSRDWISSGNLLNRLQFADLLAQDRFPGLHVEWKPFLRHPENPVEDLAPLLLPGREVAYSELSPQKLGQPGDGSPPNRAWFLPKTPPDLERRRQQVLCVKVAAVLLGSPAFQYR